MFFKILKSIDSFAVEHVPPISLNEKSKKSCLGGMVTLIVHAVSLAYFCYIISEWFSGNILPKSTSIKNAQNYSQYIEQPDQNTRLVEFSYWKYSPQLIDPFREINNILMPIAFYFYNGTPSEPVSLIGNNEISDFSSALIQIKNMTLVQNGLFDKNLQIHTEILIAVIKCDPKLLKQNQSCASDQEIEDFFDVGVNFIAFWINLKQFDPLSSDVKILRKMIYFPFSKQMAQYGQLIFQQTKATIDSGFLFESSSVNQYINDIQLFQTACQIEFWTKLLKYDTYFSLFLRLDPIRSEVQVTYVKIGEILAQVGSIISVLLMIKYIIVMYNKHLLENQLIQDVLEIYFPKLDTLHQVEKDVVIQQFKNVAKQKLLLTNIIYEISRLQYFIQKKFPDGRYQLLETHILGKNYEQDMFSVKSLENDGSLVSIPFRKDDIKLLIRNQEQIQIHSAKIHNVRSY